MSRPDDLENQDDNNNYNGITLEDGGVKATTLECELYDFEAQRKKKC
jgi:hypothetical protein